ncbi:alginate O-acetyltransferase AlgX-related protein [Deinococcus depolymerans]|uniref:Alginate O-acetyltransferase n=1 Tax=Deinococcus depolymerans TaxID=392408 RepID=A0ABP3LV89_9DEIO
MTEFAQDTVKSNANNPAAPAVLHWLPAAFLLGVVAVGAVLTVLTPTVRQWPQGKAVVTGEAMVTYEKENLDAKVPWRDASVNLWGGLNARLFGEARDGALIGKEGWLFTSEEYQTSAGDAAEIQGKLAYIQEVRDELKKDGAQLVVALIPAKARVYADQTNAKVPAQTEALYQSFHTELEKAGIPAPDLLTAFENGKSRSDLFFKTDTHWTPTGAQVAAQAIAPVVTELGFDLPAAEYTAQTQPEVPRAGDLTRYVPGADRSDLVSPITYERNDEGGGGLFGDEGIAVTLVGTSYSAETKDNVWHFDGALAAALGTEVLNMAREGKGPIVPMREYLISPERKDYPAQIVIWEIPERFLREDYKEDDS